VDWAGVWLLEKKRIKGKNSQLYVLSTNMPISVTLTEVQQQSAMWKSKTSCVVFRVMTTWRLVSGRRRFRAIYCLHIYGKIWGKCIPMQN
jgi:hypothetical protein